MYECVIIGGGPAGLTAGIYTARKNLKTLLLSKDIGGQMILSSDIENYSGFSMITGAELTAKFRMHAEQVKDFLEIMEGVEVLNIEKNIKSFVVDTKDGKQYYGKTVIIATGKRPRHLGIPGEKEFFGRGVAVCATCDAPLYKHKAVAVVGGGNSAMDAILALAKVANVVYSVNINNALVGDEFLKNKVEASPVVKFYNSTKALEMKGSNKVEGLVIEGSGGKKETLSVDGVFIEIGYEPNNDFDLLSKKNASGEIITDQNLQTNVPGLFAAGDINDAWGEQIVIAAGEGAKAAIAVGDFLARAK